MYQNVFVQVRGQYVKGWLSEGITGHYLNPLSEALTFHPVVSLSITYGSGDCQKGRTASRLREDISELYEHSLT